jgi:PHD/YefM family antitoxin component YafN of YafNO toxin-antitoxin module
MNTVPQIVPVSEMAIHQQDVMRLLDNGPVVLASRSKAAAVLVSVQVWDALINELDTLHDKLDVQEADLLLGDSELEEFNLDELKQMASHVLYT